jgi:hypothetical protein
VDAADAEAYRPPHFVWSITIGRDAPPHIDLLRVALDLCDNGGTLPLRKKRSTSAES